MSHWFLSRTTEHRKAAVGLSMADPKAVLKGRPWVAFVIRLALPGLPGDRQPVDGDNKNCHQGGFKKPALGCLFIRLALVCLETGTTRGW